MARYQAAWESAKLGDLEAIPADIRIRHLGSLQKIGQMYQQAPPAVDVLDFWWFQGPSGSGKSKTARAENPDLYLKLPTKWWDGYVDQECVLIDEWEPHHSVLGSHLKRWADHHAFAAEKKGSSVAIRPKKLIVTSNFTIEECFSEPGVQAPLLRRFTIRNFPEEASSQNTHASQATA